MLVIAKLLLMRLLIAELLNCETQPIYYWLFRKCCVLCNWENYEQFSAIFLKKEGKFLNLISETVQKMQCHIKIKASFPKKVDSINIPTKIHVHQHTQHKQQTRRWNPFYVTPLLSPILFCSSETHI